MVLLLNESSPLARLSEVRFPGLEKVVLDPGVIPLTGCVLLGLVMFVCLVRWLARGAVLRRARKADVRFTAVFRSSAHVLALFQEGEVVQGSPRSALYTNACRELAFHLLGTDAVDKSFAMKLRAAGRIMPSQWQAAQRASRRSVEETARWLRSGQTGTGVNCLIGVGLLASLLALMEHAGAGTLAWTAAASSALPLALALLFQIVGSAWHRHLVRRTEAAVADLEDFSMELGMLFERSFVDHRHPMEALPSLGGMGMSDGPTFSLPPSEPTRAVAGR
jgi:biopolymer transport protein TolQ